MQQRPPARSTAVCLKRANDRDRGVPQIRESGSRAKRETVAVRDAREEDARFREYIRVLSSAKTDAASSACVSGKNIVVYALASATSHRRLSRVSLALPEQTFLSVYAAPRGSFVAPPTTRSRFSFRHLLQRGKNRKSRRDKLD